MPHDSMRIFSEKVMFLEISTSSDRPVPLNIGSNNMSKLVKDLKHFQVIDKPTCITPNSASLLDLVITNRKDMMRICDVEPSPIADHDAIQTTLNLRKPKRPPIYKTFRCLKDYSQEAFCNMLFNELHKLNEILNTDFVHKQVEILTNVVITNIDICAPVVTKEIVRPPAPWISDDIKESMKERDKLQYDLKNDNENLVLRENYKETKKRVQSTIHVSRKQHYKQEFNDAKDISAKWRVVKHMLYGNSNDLDQNDIYGNLAGRAEMFNDFFANVGENTFRHTQNELNMNNDDPLYVQENNEDIFHISNLNSFKPTPVDCETVILTIKNLKKTNA